MKKIIRLVMGAFQTNTYVVIAADKAVVIDPAENAEIILDTLKTEGASLTHILLTHGHFDHTSAVAALKNMTNAPIHIHEKDAPMLTDIEKSFAALMPSRWKPCQADVLLNDGDVISVTEDLQFKIINTPGHSGGSSLYIVDDVMFSGDTLFAGSVGRIDGWSGNHYEQMESLEKIKALEGDYRVLPGHGDETTLSIERRNNPFFT